MATRANFTEDPKEEISGNQISRAKEASYPCYYASRGRNYFYFGYFQLRAILRVDYCVDALRGCLDYFKTTLMTVLRHDCGRFCVLICSCVLYVLKFFRDCLD